jgi:hypothetical protein
MTKPDQHDPKVRMIHAPEPIPVFGCQVIVTPAGSGALWRGRCANYAGIEVTGDSERAVLQQFVKTFKAFAAAKLERQEEMPTRSPPEPPNPGEQVRWIAVHL